MLDGSIDNGTSTFVLEGESTTLTISFLDATVSNGLGDNRTVYAEGTLKETEEVGCLKRRRSRHLALRSTKKKRRLIEIESA